MGYQRHLLLLPYLASPWWPGFSLSLPFPKFWLSSLASLIWVASVSVICVRQEAMVILTGDIAKCRMRWMKNLSAEGLGWIGRLCLEWTRDNDDASIASRVSLSCDIIYYRHMQVTVVYKSYKHVDLVLHSHPVYWRCEPRDKSTRRTTVVRSRNTFHRLLNTRVVYRSCLATMLRNPIDLEHFSTSSTTTAARKLGLTGPRRASIKPRTKVLEYRWRVTG
jgi:hypothetical protein